MRVSGPARIGATALLAWALSSGTATAATAHVAPTGLTSVSAAVVESRTSISIGDIDLDGPAINPITVTIKNDSARAMSNLKVTLDGPVGWTVQGPRTLTGQLLPGRQRQVTFDVQVPERRPGFRTYTFRATVEYRGGDGARSATAARTVHTGTVLPNLAAAFNNVGVTNESATTPGNFDGSGNSFSAQKLADVGITPGATVSALGAAFTWPTAAPGTPGNVASGAQAIDLSGKGSKVAFLGSGSSQSATGLVTVFYTDGTSSSGSLGFPNWSFQDAGAHGATLVASSVGRNRPNGYGDAAYAYRVFANSVSIDSSKTVDFILLPSNGAVHIFDMVVVP